MKYYLIVDLGTGNTRVALVSSLGRILGIRTFTNTYYKDEKYPDAQYFIPNEWEREIYRCCEELHREFPDIRVSAVSSAGARQSIVLLDNEGKAFYGLPNIDNRGRDYMGQIQETDRIYELSGKWVTEDFCAAKIMGLKKLRPELYERIDKIVSVSEWICCIFTGIAAMEHSQACETELYDIEQKVWSTELCRAYGIKTSVLPPLASAGTKLASVLPRFIEKYRMEDNAVFVIGGADTQVALRQVPMKYGDIAIVSGTTSPVVTLSEKKYYDPQQRVWEDTDLGGLNYLTEMNPGVTGLNYQRVKAALCPDLSYDRLEKIYSEKTEFHCTASFSSLLFYRRCSLRNGGFFMESPFSFKADKTDMCYAVLADIACSVYEQLYRLIDLTKNNSRYIYGLGGGFQSNALRQMIADLSGLELRLYPGYEQATVQGLVKLCNVSFNLENNYDSSDYLSYTPKKDSLIHKYYPVWLKNRVRANS